MWRTFFKTVLSRILFSYFIIAVITLSFVLLVSDAVFRYRMNTEIEGFNQRMMEKTAYNIKNTIFDPVRRIYLEMVWSGAFSPDITYFSRNEIEGNSLKMLALHQALTALVTRNSDVIESIHLYYPDTGILASSSYGYKKVSAENMAGSSEFGWVDLLDASARNRWVPTRAIDDGFFTVKGPGSPGSSSIKSNSLSFVSKYYDRGVCLIAVNIEEAVLRSAMLEIMPLGYSSVHIVDGTGAIISSTDDSMLYRPYASPELLLKVGHTSLNLTVDGMVCSITKLDVSDWHVVGTISLEVFYEASDSFRYQLILAGIIIFIAASLLSLVFSLKMYRPIQRLHHKIAGRMNAPDSLRRNEYEMIDTAIDSMFGRIDSLQHTLAANGPAIKYHFIERLVEGRFASMEEVESNLALINCSLKRPYFACAVFHLGCHAFRQLDLMNRKYAQYGVVDGVDGIKASDAVFLSRSFSEERVIVVINSARSSTAVFGRLLDSAREKLPPPVLRCLRIACSRFVSSPLELSTAYKEALGMFDYAFFRPQSPLLFRQDIIYLENSSRTISDHLLENFEASLTTINLAQVSASLDALLRELKAGGYQARYAHTVILKLLAVLANYKKNMKAGDVRQLKQEIYERFNDVDDIDQFRGWVMDFVNKVFSTLAARCTRSQNRELVNNVQSFIRRNLGGDLSLEAIAANFFVSSKHLCRIFKEETDDTLSNYINTRRMEKAAELLADSRHSVEQVGGLVGFNSFSYFIKKFKEFYGVTPKIYRRKLFEDK